MTNLRLIYLVMALVLTSGCASRRQLPALKAANSIVVEITPRDRPAEKIRREIDRKSQIDAVVGFVNAQPGKWSVPWYGPPVGTIYFKFFTDGKYLGNFYIGPIFFGRDVGNFWSQPTTRKKIEDLEKISGIELWRYIGATERPSSTK